MTSERSGEGGACGASPSPRLAPMIPSCDFSDVDQVAALGNFQKQVFQIVMTEAAKHLGGRTICNQTGVVEEQDPFAKLFYLDHVVGGQENGEGALLVHGADQIPHLVG